VGLRVKKIRSPEVIPRDWRDASGEDAWSSSLLLRDRWIEEEDKEEDEIDCDMVCLNCWRVEEAEISIFRVCFDSRDLILSFMVAMGNKQSGA
jgi:hypothetical protein